MTVLPLLSTIFLTWAASPTTIFQQGGGMRQQDEGSTQSIDIAISSYLDAQPQKGIVTPGDFNEWPLDLKAGQIVIADSESDAFDPAIEMVDEKGGVLAKNDDRYPGDQRPLLFWRCPSDGKYGLRVRSFQDKAGGQSFTRFKVYDTFDIGSGAQPTEKWVETSRRMLVRVPMKKGEIKQLVFEQPDGWYYMPQLGRAISPIGLPNTQFSRPLDRAINNTIMAPADGDYYVVANVSIPQRRKLRGVTRAIVPGSLSATGSVHSATVPTNNPNLWLINAKAGDFIEVTSPELSMGAQIVLADAPDIAKFDLSKPEANPFFPKAPDALPEPGPSFVELPARARDPRIRVFAVRRDAKLWLASNGQAQTAKTYTMTVKPADRAFTVSTSRSGGDEIWIMNADGSGQSQIVPGDGYGYIQPSWGPDGKIVYVRFLGDHDIFTMNADYSNRKRITDYSYQEFKPTWGPNGKIAYVSDKSNWQDIFIMDEDGSNQMPLTNNGRTNDTQPCFGPDGRIAFCSDRDDEDEEIYIMNADGTGQKRLTNSKGRDYWPSWGPDGRIAFVSDRNGQADIYVMNQDGTNVKRLTDSKLDDKEPSFGPNGMIAFYSRRGDGDGDVWMVKAPK